MKYVVWTKGQKMVVKTDNIKDARQVAFISTIETRKPTYIGAQNNDRLTEELGRNDQMYCAKHRFNGSRYCVGLIDRRGVVGFLDQKGNVVGRPVGYSLSEAQAKYYR